MTLVPRVEPHMRRFTGNIAALAATRGSDRRYITLVDAIKVRRSKFKNWRIGLLKSALRFQKGPRLVETLIDGGAQSQRRRVSVGTRCGPRGVARALWSANGQFGEKVPRPSEKKWVTTAGLDSVLEIGRASCRE